MVTTSEQKTCPDACPFKRFGCYADSGPLQMLWAKLSNAGADETEIQNGRAMLPLFTFKEFLAAVKRQSGKLWRMSQAGDLPGKNNVINRAKLNAIVAANKVAGALGFTYSHKPVLGESPIAAKNREVIKHANDNGFTINLSANNLRHADLLIDLKIGPVASVVPMDQTTNTTTPRGRKVVICPATQRDDVSCATCGLCQRQRDFVIGFPAHGTSKRKADQIAKGDF